MEKLSDRLTELFAKCVYRYDFVSWENMLEATDSETSTELAKKMSEHVLDMIAKYEPEDIE